MLMQFDRFVRKTFLLDANTLRLLDQLDVALCEFVNEMYWERQKQHATTAAYATVCLRHPRASRLGSHTLPLTRQALAGFRPADDASAAAHAGDLGDRERAGASGSNDAGGAREAGRVPLPATRRAVGVEAQSIRAAGPQIGPLVLVGGDAPLQLQRLPDAGQPALRLPRGVHGALPQQRAAGRVVQEFNRLFQTTAEMARITELRPVPYHLRHSGASAVLASGLRTALEVQRRDKCQSDMRASNDPPKEAAWRSRWHGCPRMWSGTA